MTKISSLFVPIELIFTPGGAIVDPGTIIQLDTNIEDTIILYTLDGSLPIDGNFGTYRSKEDSINVELKATTRIRARAFKRTQPEYTTKTLEEIYTIARKETPMENFKTVERFYMKLIDTIVDLNFYNKEGWVIPTSKNKLYYLFVNKESFPVRVNFLHNGIPFSINTFPQIDPEDFYEFPVSPISGENSIEIQTSRIY